MKQFATWVVLSCLVAPAMAQKAEAARKELAKREAAAARDAEALMKVGEWAREQGLAEDAKRIFQNVLKLKADHKGANEALGNVLVDGVWMTGKDAEKAKQKAIAAANAAKGLVEVDGIWVPKEQAEDAKKGIFKFGNEVVTKAEFVGMSEGKVRHPITGELIDSKDLAQAKARKFPVGNEGRWVDEAEADRVHSDLARAWTVRTKGYTFITTLPIAKIEAIREHAERALDRIKPILGGVEPLPASRPVVLVAASQGEFRQLGNRMGDAASAYGAFLADERASIDVPLQGETRPVVCLWDDNWGPYNLPHAIGLGLLSSVCSDLELEVPSWFMQGLAAYGSRFESPGTGAWFSQRLAKAGGLRDLGDWFGKFAIDGKMEFDEIDATMTQAGLMFDFCLNGKDDGATQALVALTTALQARKVADADKAIKNLQTTLASKQAAIADYLVKLVKAGG